MSYASLKIDLTNIVENYSILKKQVKTAEVACVVKANAYGLGVKQVAVALQKAGCKKFFVASLEEAIELRNILKNHGLYNDGGVYNNGLHNKDIYIFHGFRKDEVKEIEQYNLLPVLNDIEQVKLWQGVVSHKPTILHLDTGMNRLGLTAKEFIEISEKDKILNLNIDTIMTHPACADEATHPKNIEQLQIFKSLCQDNDAKFQNNGIKLSFANSSACFLGEEYLFDLVRTGSALYGVNPAPAKKNPMKQVINLTSKIIQIRNIDRESTIGYGATKVVEAGTKVAVIEIGYADGVMRAAGNNFCCYFLDFPLPVLGRISMDLITIDISAVPNNLINLGDEIEIIGEKFSLDDFAAAASTIGYEILTRMGNRMQRVYIKA